MAVMAVFVSVVCVLITTWSLKLLYAIWWRPRMIERQLRKQGIHGPPYRLLHGNTNEMMKLSKESGSKPSLLPHDIMPRVNPFLLKMAMTYKNIFVVWFGTTPRVIITDPKLIREVLANKSGDFMKPKIESLELFTTGLANINGDNWARHRRIISPAFHIEKLKRMLPAFYACSEEMIEKWHKLVDSAGSCELDLSLEFQNLTGDVISRAAFGSSFEEGTLIFQLQKEQAQLLLQSMMKINFPWSRFLPTKVDKRMRQIYKEVQALLRGITEKREKAIQLGIREKDDLLGLLLESNLGCLQESENSSAGMKTEDVIEECRLFYFAGQETTSNLLTWSMILLSMCKSWQERAREEVLQAIGRNKPSFDDLSNLKMVNMILLEVLRLYPPTSLLRSTHKKTKLGALMLPAGVQILVPVHIVHRDPEQWGEDAMEFNPERFSEGISKATKDQTTSYFPFGWGPRICVGQNFAMLEAKLALTLILQNFEFELSPSYTHAPSVALTLKPGHGAQIILHKLQGRD